MNPIKYDFVLLTQKEYINPVQMDAYTQNILLEDNLLTKALEERGFRVTRTHWNNEAFDWESASCAVFRATWDYFHRIDEFKAFIKQRSTQIQFINSQALIEWNMDKHYLGDLQKKGIAIPPTRFIEKESQDTLRVVFDRSGWDKAVLKPAIGGGARHTYLIDNNNVACYQSVFESLISSEALLLQAFQSSILTKGEVSFMVFGGQYSHAVLKQAKSGDFRVQDDFGGSLHPYNACEEDIDFVKRVVHQCAELPVYARVDVLWDEHNKPCLSELELIEPELWFRRNAQAAERIVEAICLKPGLLAYIPKIL